MNVCGWGLTKSPFTIHKFNSHIPNLVWSLMSLSGPTIIHFYLESWTLIHVSEIKIYLKKQWKDVYQLKLVAFLKKKKKKKRLF